MVSTGVLLAAAMCSVAIGNVQGRGKSSSKSKSVCRACGKLGAEVAKRMEQTAANPRVIEVAGRIGPDGRPIPSRKIDYLGSEARFMDVFADICDELEHSTRSDCYLIVNEYEDQLRDWFFQSRSRPFVSEFCYKIVPGCNEEVEKASATDIDMEDYEANKHKIDPDFMPEASEEAVKKGESFAAQTVERVKDVRDNVLDAWERVDVRAKKWLLRNVVHDSTIAPYLRKIVAKERAVAAIEYWYVLVISIVLALALPLVGLLCCSRGACASAAAPKRSATMSKNAASASRLGRGKKKAASSESDASEPSTGEEESDAVDADDEKSEVRRGTRGSRIVSSAASSVSPSRTASSRTSRVSVRSRSNDME